MKKVKELYHKCMQKMKASPEWTITGLFTLFVILSFGISYNLALRTTSGTGEKKLPIYCVETDKPQIAISFDAAWGNDDTRKILEILEKHNVKATFFMTGGWVE